VLAHWAVVGLFGAVLGAAACGGSTKALEGEPSAAGSGVAAGSSSAAGGTAGLAGVGGGGGAALAGETGQAGAPSLPWGTGIVPEALEGCRGPSDAGCEVCYWATSEGRSCTRESGGDSVYVEYVALDGPCPADGPRCASCSYDYERGLRALGERPECGCNPETTDTAPCQAGLGSCGCYCNAFGKFIRACPSLDN
jgi:hypothetical protein